MRRVAPLCTPGASPHDASGVGLAPYDLLGKVDGVAVYGLLGGAKRERVSVCTTGRNSELCRQNGFMDTRVPHRWTGDETDHENVMNRAQGLEACTAETP